MYAARMFFCEEIEDTMVDDEIDELFGKLEQMVPPPALIEGIMAQVARLPLPRHLTPLDVEETTPNESGTILQFPSNPQNS
jgi:hypothetical protein